MKYKTRSLIYRFKPSVIAAAVSLALFANVPVFADSNYGPIAPGETLSKIVNENYIISPFSDAVIMREIFRENPGAFINNDIGLLRQGVILVLPDDNSIRRSSGAMSSAVVAEAPVNTVSSTQVTQTTNRLLSVQDNLRATQAERDRLKASLSQSQTELSSLKARYDSAQKIITELESKQSSEKSGVLEPQLATDTSALEEAINDVTSERDALKLQLSQANTSLDELKAKLELTPEGESGLKEQLEAALSNAESLQLELTAATNELATTTKSLAEANQSLESTKQGSSQQSVALIGAELNRQKLEKSNALIAEKDEKIAELTESISALEKQLSEADTTEEPVTPEVAPVNTVDAGKLAESEKTITVLNQQLVAYREEVKELKSQNDELVNELMNTAEPVDDMDALIDVDPLIADGLALGSGSITVLDEADSNKNFLTKSITLPAWNALLALLALGLTSLMLLARRNKSQVAEIGEEANSDVVFKSGSLKARDQDVESLRVPPRRDPSRVAILDPSMTSDLSEPPVDNTKAPLVSSSESEQETVESTTVSNDSNLKLAMAEAYIELSDAQAANELLHEVLLEGSDQQKSSAELLMSRLAG